MLSCDFGLVEGLRYDEITHRFGLRQIDASVEKSAHGEFARFGKTPALGQRQLDDVPQHHGRTVSGDFHDVVGGVGMRLGEIGDDDFVDAVFVWPRATRPRFAGSGTRMHTIRIGLDQFAEHGASRLNWVFEAKHRQGDGASFGAGKADHADTAASGRSGNRDDSVVQVHGEIVLLAIVTPPRGKLCDAMTKSKLAIVAILLLTVLHSAALDQKKSNASDYETLVNKLKSSDRSVDFRALRLAYADSSASRTGPDTDPDKKAMNAALNANDFESAIKHAETVLAGDYVDMDAHFVEYIANRELKAADKADFHKFILQGLLKSITDSGDGKTPETAYQVIEVHEEYALLHFMGVGLPESQSYLHKNGHAYDEIKLKDPHSGQEIAIYFNVDIPAKRGL